MTKRFIPATLDCIGCAFCVLRTCSDDRNILTCKNPSIMAGHIPDDVAFCFVADAESEGDEAAHISRAVATGAVLTTTTRQ